MYRGTNPGISFRITSESFELSNIKEVWITLKTWETEKTFVYSKGEVFVDEISRTIAVTLTQEDTLEFEDGTVEVQMRLLDTSDNAFATQIFEIEMERILKDGVIKREDDLMTSNNLSRNRR